MSFVNDFGAPFLVCPATVTYAPRAALLATALADHGWALTIAPYPSEGGWEANTRRRAGVALAAVAPRPGVPAWLLDADIAVRDDPYPIFAPKLWPAGADIAVCRRHDKAARDPGFAVAAGLVGWCGDRGAAFMRDWAERCAGWTANADETRSTAAPVEQACFAAAVRHAERTGARVVEVPPEFHATPEDVPRLWRPAVLVNECASRTMRRVVG